MMNLLAILALALVLAPLATPNCSTYGRSNCPRQDGVSHPTVTHIRHASLRFSAHPADLHHRRWVGCKKPPQYGGVNEGQ